MPSSGSLGPPESDAVTRFKAHRLAAEEFSDAGTFVVVLAEGTSEGARLEIQQSFEFDDQDRALGQDTYCLANEAGATHYGGVKRWSLDGRALHIELERGAAEALSFDRQIFIELEA